MVDARFHCAFRATNYRRNLGDGKVVQEMKHQDIAILGIEMIKCPMNVRSILDVKRFVVAPFRGLGPNPLGALARTIGAHAVHG